MDCRPLFANGAVAANLAKNLNQDPHHHQQAIDLSQESRVRGLSQTLGAASVHLSSTQLGEPAIEAPGGGSSSSAGGSSSMQPPHPFNVLIAEFQHKR